MDPEARTLIVCKRYISCFAALPVDDIDPGGLPVGLISAYEEAALGFDVIQTLGHIAAGETRDDEFLSRSFVEITYRDPEPEPCPEEDNSNKPYQNGQDDKGDF